MNKTIIKRRGDNDGLVYLSSGSQLHLTVLLCMCSSMVSGRGFSFKIVTFFFGIYRVRSSVRIRFWIRIGIRVRKIGLEIGFGLGLGLRVGLELLMGLRQD